MKEKEIIHNIEIVMERWHLGRDEDHETIEAINNIMLKGGRLKFHNRGVKNNVVSSDVPNSLDQKVEDMQEDITRLKEFTGLDQL